jgi:hypothetical protein
MEAALSYLAFFLVSRRLLRGDEPRAEPAMGLHGLFNVGVAGFVAVGAYASAC